MVAESTDSKTSETINRRRRRLSKIHGTEEGRIHDSRQRPVPGARPGARDDPAAPPSWARRKLDARRRLDFNGQLVMQGLCEDLGFHLSPAPEAGRVRAVLNCKKKREVLLTILQ